MFCPQCRVEYREGFTVCADCGAELVAALPPERGEFIEVWAGVDLDEPLFVLLCEALEESGIEFFPRRSVSAGMLPAGIDFGAPLAILVHNEETERARGLIQECVRSFSSATPEEDAAPSEPR